MAKQVVNFEEARMLCELGFKDDVERVYDSSDKEAGLLNYGEVYVVMTHFMLLRTSKLSSG